MPQQSPSDSTLFEKVWQRHLVRDESTETPAILYIDLHLLHEGHYPSGLCRTEKARIACTASRPLPGHYRSLHTDLGA